MYCSNLCRRAARNKRRSHKGDAKDEKHIKITEKLEIPLVPYKKKDPLEYWHNYKEQILESEREFDFKGVHLVGGIEVHEENFEYLVVQQLEN